MKDLHLDSEQLETIQSAFKSGATDLLEAVMTSVSYEVFMSLLKTTDANGFNPLHNAAKEGHIAVFEFLKQKLKPQDFSLLLMKQSTSNWTALAIAVHKNKAELAEFLAKNNPQSLELKNSRDCTPLHIAADKEEIQLLRELIKINPEALRNDPDILKIKEAGKKLMHLAADETDMELLTVLAHCSGENFLPMLLGKAESVTPLHLLARNGNIEFFRIIKNKTTSAQFAKLLEGQNPKKMTPLFIATFKNNSELAELLAAGNSETVSLRNSDGFSALHVAVNKGLTDLAVTLSRLNPQAMLVQNNMGLAPIHQAVQDGNIAFIEALQKSLTEKHFEELLKIRTQDGSTPLNIAAKSGNAQIANLIVQTLLKAGNDWKTIMQEDENRQSPSYSAAFLGHTEFLQVLHGNGIPTEVLLSNQINGTAFVAAYMQRQETLDFLISVTPHELRKKYFGGIEKVMKAGLVSLSPETSKSLANLNSPEHRMYEVITTLRTIIPKELFRLISDYVGVKHKGKDMRENAIEWSNTIDITKNLQPGDVKGVAPLMTDINGKPIAARVVQVLEFCELNKVPKNIESFIKPYNKIHRVAEAIVLAARKSAGEKMGFFDKAVEKSSKPKIKKAENEVFGQLLEKFGDDIGSLKSFLGLKVDAKLGSSLEDNAKIKELATKIKGCIWVSDGKITDINQYSLSIVNFFPKLEQKPQIEEEVSAAAGGPPARDIVINRRESSQLAAGAGFRDRQ